METAKTHTDAATKRPTERAKICTTILNELLSLYFSVCFFSLCSAPLYDHTESPQSNVKLLQRTSKYHCGHRSIAAQMKVHFDYLVGLNIISKRLRDLDCKIDETKTREKLTFVQFSAAAISKHEFDIYRRTRAHFN